MQERSMLIGLGTGSSGTAALAEMLGLPHEKRFLPWRTLDCPEFAEKHLPRIVDQGGEVGLYLLPYVETIMSYCPTAKFICMQRDQERTVRGLVRKLNDTAGERNVFANANDAASFSWGFPFYGPSVTLEEGSARFYREFYERAYALQRRFPDRFRIFMTDHLIQRDAPEELERERKRIASFVDLNRDALRRFLDWPEHEPGVAAC